jgi:putative sigma-54 modulation protein
MNLQYVFHQLESTDAIKQKIDTKAKKLKKYFHSDFDVKWVCSVEKNAHHSHVTVSGHGLQVDATATDDSLYKTFDEVIAKLEKQLDKNNKQVQDKIHRKTAQNMEVFNVDEE